MDALKSRWLKIVLIGAGVFFLAGLGLFFNCGFRGCPDVKLLRAYIPDEASVVVDRNNEEIGKLYRVKRTIVPLDSLPEYVPQAFVAVEDQRFWSHGGVDWQRVPGALIANVKSRGVAQGFSTITMQLARNIFPDKLKAQERTITRKIAEMRVAMKIENRFTKRDIIELYLNQIYFGNSAWGIEAASQEYFGKSAKQLTVAEAAMLAGIPQAPSRSNPRADADAAKKRRNLVLDRMAEQKLIAESDAEAAKEQPVKLRRAKRGPGAGNAPYFVEAVRTLLEDQLGDAIYTKGLTIRTTLDLRAQHVAEQELFRQMSAIESGAYGAYRHPRYAPTRPGQDSTAEEGTKYLQGALVMLDARSGEVLAYIGGRDFNDSKFDRAQLARRQPGSAFKPFVYTAAVQAGYSPNYVIADTPLRLAVDRSKFWEPQNYDHAFRGAVTMRQALTESRNVPTVRLAEAVGIGRVIDTAHQLGLNGNIPPLPAVVLGTAEVTPLELVDSYTAFATLGDHVSPTFVREVVDRSGNVLWAQPSERAQVLDPAVAFIVTDMLRDVVNRGTATAVRAAGYRGPAAGKTGTTQDGADAWYVGYTPRVVMGLWLGLDRRQPITGDASGGHLAAPVWGRIMARVATPTEDWQPPPGVEKRWVDGSGQLVSSECPSAGPATEEYFMNGTAPERSCFSGYTTAVDTMMPPADDQGWWDRMRERIFGEDSTSYATPMPTQPAPGQTVPVQPMPGQTVPAQPGGGIQVQVEQPPSETAPQPGTGDQPDVLGRPVNPNRAQTPQRANPTPQPQEPPSQGTPADGAQPAPPPPQEEPARAPGDTTGATQ